MSEATTDSFLDGQGIAVNLPNIETELVKLWGPAAEQVGGPDLDNPHVTRVVLANLVVESMDGPCEELRPVLETVMAQFPCRAIVVRGTGEAGGRIAAEVSALCHLSAPGLPQVCSERIVLRAGRDASALIPGAVRPLLEADLPIVLWWTTDPRNQVALFRALADECSRLILDLPDPGAQAGALRLGLDPDLCPFSRDAAWFGIARWRELVAQFFDCSGHLLSLKQIESVEIEAVSPDPARPPRQAVWLAAWLAGQLGWKPHEFSRKATAPETSAVSALFATGDRIARIDISTQTSQEKPRVMGVSIRANGPEGHATFRLSRTSPHTSAVRVEATAVDACYLPSVVDAPELDGARRIAAALESSRTDPPFQRARPIALWFLEELQ